MAGGGGGRGPGAAEGSHGPCQHPPSRPTGKTQGLCLCGPNTERTPEGTPSSHAPAPARPGGSPREQARRPHSARGKSPAATLGTHSPVPAHASRDERASVGSCDAPSRELGVQRARGAASSGCGVLHGARPLTTADKVLSGQQRGSPLPATARPPGPAKQQPLSVGTPAQAQNQRGAGMATVTGPNRPLTHKFWSQGGGWETHYPLNVDLFLSHSILKFHLWGRRQAGWQRPAGMPRAPLPRPPPSKPPALAARCPTPAAGPWLLTGAASGPHPPRALSCRFLGH